MLRDVFEGGTNQETEAYIDISKRFVGACEPIVNHFWQVRLQTFRSGTPEHLPVIAPSGNTGNNHLYIADSGNLPGWFTSPERKVEDGDGIAIMKYSGDISQRGDIFWIGSKRETLGLDEHEVNFNQLPNELLIVRAGLFGKPGELTSGLGVAEYTKDYLEQNAHKSGKFWRLDQDIAQMYWPYNGNRKGINLYKDAKNMSASDMKWPFVYYAPYRDKSKVFWNEGKVSKNVSGHTSELEKIIKKWLAPFAGGVREVPQDQV